MKAIKRCMKKPNRSRNGSFDREGKKDMKTCYIFGAAPTPEVSWIHVAPDEEDAVICADGGYQLARRAGIKPDWLVGDFDSNRETVDFDQVIRVKPEKDDTDIYLAVSHGRKLGYTRFVIYGALGGRFDHSIANVQMLKGMIKEGIQITLLDAQNEVTAMMDTSMEIPKSDFRYFSLFSLTEVCEGVTIKGGAYPLTDYTLTSDFPLGVSNEVAEEKAAVSVKKGILLVIRSKDAHPNEKNSI